MVSPWILISVRASFTSSILKGFIIASTFFMNRSQTEIIKRGNTRFFEKNQGVAVFWHTCTARTLHQLFLDVYPQHGYNDFVSIKVVLISKRAQKDLRKAPHFIIDKLETWVDAVERDGLEEVQKIRGYRDEALRGKRKGQRSIRLSLGYRAIYRILKDGTIKFVRIEEVTKHEY
jgi:proteic killer suppression protein